MLRDYMLVFLLHTACGDLIYARVGENVTLHCFFPGAIHLSWYKQRAGEQPRIISHYYKGSHNTFYDKFKGGRFSVDTAGDLYNLNISDVQDSDSALYFCGSTSIAVTQFNKGTFLMLKESSSRCFLQQPESDSGPPGGSASLNCTVFTGTTDEEHSVYWFKRDSQASHLGTMFIHTNSSGKCVMSSGSDVFSSSVRGGKRLDSGTYHCAVASCGRTLFGKETKPDMAETNCESVVVRYVVPALAASLMLNVVLLFILHKKARRQNLHPAGPKEPEGTIDSQNEVKTDVQYVALDFQQRKDKRSPQRRSEEDTVYSTVKVSHRK